MFLPGATASGASVGEGDMHQAIARGALFFICCCLLAPRLDAAIHASVSAEVFGARETHAGDTGAIAIASYHSEVGDTHIHHHASASSANGVLRASATVFEHGGPRAGAFWTDTLTISSAGQPLPTSLLFRFHFSAVLGATLSAPTSEIPIPTAEASATFFVSDMFGNIYFSAGAGNHVSLNPLPGDPFNELRHQSAGVRFGTFTGFTFSPGSDAISGELTFPAQVSDGTLTYLWSLQAVTAARLGFAHADASHTAELVAILLPDGTTPESQGFTLTFDSGMASPNLATAAVPEPGSLFIWSTSFLLGLAASARKMGRRAAPHL
jgi:hypothetical protein